MKSAFPATKPVEINILDDIYGSLIPLLNKIKIVQKYKAAKTLARENAKIQSRIRTLLGLAGAVGAFSLVCCAGATAFVLGNKVEDSVSRGNWTERTSPDLPDGEAASKELQAAQAPAIFVITCGEYNGDPQSVSSASFIFNKGGYPESVPNDTSLSLFKGFEEVIPHPLTVCKNAEVGSTWQIPLKATR